MSGEKIFEGILDEIYELSYLWNSRELSAVIYKRISWG